MITGLLHAAISVRDMERSLAFYRDLLGGRIIFKKDEPAGCPFIICLQYPGGSCLELFYPRSEYPLGDQLGRNHFCLITDDIFETERALCSAGIPVTSRPKIVSDGNYQLWCEDPNGYRVEIMQLMPGCPQLTGACTPSGD